MRTAHGARDERGRGIAQSEWFKLIQPRIKLRRNALQRKLGVAEYLFRQRLRRKPFRGVGFHAASQLRHHA